MLSLSKIILASSTLVAGAFGTNIRVNTGCINVNDHIFCNPNYVSVDGGSATIWAQFDGNNHNPSQTAGCKLLANWPANYGDIYLGADNCLYDANNQVINGQCCVNGSADGGQVRNPYVQ